jgi:hypothetical protein
MQAAIIVAAKAMPTLMCEMKRKPTSGREVRRTTNAMKAINKRAKAKFVEFEAVMSAQEAGITKLVEFEAVMSAREAGFKCCVKKIDSIKTNHLSYIT